MWREKVGTSSNQSELQEGKNNKIKRFFRPTIFLKAKMGEHHEENDTELKSNLENKIPFFYSFLQGVRQVHAAWQINPFVAHMKRFMGRRQRLKSSTQLGTATLWLQMLKYLIPQCPVLKSETCYIFHLHIPVLK